MDSDSLVIRTYLVFKNLRIKKKITNLEDKILQTCSFDDRKFNDKKNLLKKYTRNLTYKFKMFNYHTTILTSNCN